MALDIHKPKGFRKAWRGGIDLTRKVTVCASCQCASCWQAAFFCENYCSAGTVEMTLAELMILNKHYRRESPEYWFKDAEGRVDHAALEALIQNYPEVSAAGSQS